MRDRYIGLMSGTSTDGVDGVVAEFADDGTPRVLADAHHDYDGGLRAELIALNTCGADELHRAALAANAVAAVYAKVVEVLRAAAPGTVRAIGAHGQTVRHRPGEFDGVGYTLQLLNPAWLAERSGIDVIADLRSRDVAAGGQGAPLVPAFHAACFARAGEDRAAINIGGIANVSLLGADGSVRGHDCGPGNLLMDGWCERHRGQPFDDGGRWAAQGRVRPDLLADLRAHPYFARRAPKSTGRDDFHLAWLDGVLARHPGLDPADVQASLCELTAVTAAADLRESLPGSVEAIVCGGGAFNLELLRRLQLALPGCRVTTSDAHGVPALQVEATAFAWLARAHVRREAGNRPAVTAAAGPRVLGACYPA
ncbi:MAG TPA: anhydro-N-acetylmuramic acid kinase [Methylibium sp.]|uniref:anhydro-N-acetylmuramic acid kinase n=1 Tax=Methylibium sp. TaxID=2067992 RepID=UPI002DB6A614|nr:anhydro-N-acetylmuramic acid kinase [Methylibium sp.]HEU4459224.1 anhydro-N-acetylmuramic acid kinase [Methylibium sp.]